MNILFRRTRSWEPVIDLEEKRSKCHEKAVLGQVPGKKVYEDHRETSNYEKSGKRPIYGGRLFLDGKKTGIARKTYQKVLMIRQRRSASSGARRKCGKRNEGRKKRGNILKSGNQFWKKSVREGQHKRKILNTSEHRTTEVRYRGRLKVEMAVLKGK